MTFPFIAELASVLDRAATLLAEHLLGLLQQGGEAAAWHAKLDCQFDVDPLGVEEATCGASSRWLDAENTLEVVVYVTRDGVQPLYKHLLCLVKAHRKKTMLQPKSEAACNSQAPPSELGDELLLLHLACPGDISLWNMRRVWFLATCWGHYDVKEHDTTCLVKELLVTSLALSHQPKVAEAWQYRRWILQQWTRRLGLEEGRDRLRMSLLCHERQALDVACDRHRMNYAAWQHRRWLLCESSLLASAPQPGGAVVDEMRSAVAFLKTHIGDASASSYLTDVLWHADGVLQPREVIALWRELFVTSWSLIRHQAHFGHESLWTLRLSLINFALRHGSLRESMGGWTLADELSLATLHAESSSSVVDHCGSLKPEDCSGSPLWNAWHAARYGLRLCRLVSEMTQPAR